MGRLSGILNALEAAEQYGDLFSVELVADGSGTLRHKRSVSMSCGCCDEEFVDSKDFDTVDELFTLLDTLAVDCPITWTHTEKRRD